MKTLFFGIVLIIFTMSVSAQKLVNPNATREANALYAYLSKISGKSTLSGQHNYGHELNRSSDTIRSYTGKYPAVWGTDFGWILGSKLVDEVINQHKKGSVITLMYHMPRPFDADTVKRSTWKKLTDEQWNDLVTPGTEINRLWMARMDTVAFYLKKLQDAKVPVLWRPFHEMNGGWFWWGNRPGPDGYQKMWKLLYDRFTNYHKLNNLIWVWNANAPRIKKDDDAMAYDLFYPGNDYVDVLAADIYNNDYRQSHHDQLLALGKGKLIAMGEIGDVPPPSVLEQQPKWCWFMIWARFPWTDNTPEEIKALYGSDRVLTRDEVKKSW